MTPGCPFQPKFGSDPRPGRSNCGETRRIRNRLSLLPMERAPAWASIARSSSSSASSTGTARLTSPSRRPTRARRSSLRWTAATSSLHFRSPTRTQRTSPTRPPAARARLLHRSAPTSKRCASTGAACCSRCAASCSRSRAVCRPSRTSSGISSPRTSTRRRRSANGRSRAPSTGCSAARTRLRLRS